MYPLFLTCHCYFSINAFLGDYHNAVLQGSYVLEIGSKRDDSGSRKSVEKSTLTVLHSTSCLWEKRKHTLCKKSRADQIVSRI